MTFLNAGFILAAYLLGSFSSAITLSKIMGFADPRSEGSNNPGATNVMRIAGKKAAALTLFGDMLKGFIPVLIASFFLQQTLFIALTGLAAFLGHCYPLYYQFKGGKGVATAIGFILAFNWVSGLIVVTIWLIIAKVFKLSSLAALIAFTCLPFIYYALQNDMNISVLLLIVTFVMTYRHKENIRRIIKGEEA
ncbi:MAG: glycerol-3-phosphate 1-O-acyltransferase PlsY [Gammaproteobacteria bacterium]|nr:glycerol-3-phosphate 1-O-acyltransferase PlsY [Gammaproteobacteria bacterium]MBT3726008.1 glycerol-3-phosphate 1-O-acyltransferase PlsY [Gammaproteobacteria bacterium]MBT4075139.1 glycerol-3-phosphate 1-O-acyltransferase PlsY [Gammaproteobacteria bacterium]MBT4195281.1 glycerol-3-phosphate 1-O-acyltransferase PlsY [Gammaproteobacteria bacterium]MBT4448624.1 glycerol-3-phosphate 1-O-acyltransferase PlsY [Gammaproteobacteria bacterium]